MPISHVLSTTTGLQPGPNAEKVHLMCDLALGKA